MSCLTIDCGTTNSRVYLVEETGRILGKAARSIGVRDTARTGGGEGGLCLIGRPERCRR